MNNTENMFGITHLLSQTDTIGRIVAGLLILMSLVSWTLIFIKIWRHFSARHFEAGLDQFWNAHNLAEGLNALSKHAPQSPFHALAEQSMAAAEHCKRTSHQSTLGGSLDAGEFITQALRKSISLSTSQLESGLTVLASIGSTAPFVGLFGTVWGIYHALITISQSGSATLDKVAGPVGETLIMTAMGLFVAIPAVLAYNAFTRHNRIMLTALDAFAHDLHAYLSTGARYDLALKKGA